MTKKDIVQKIVEELNLQPSVARKAVQRTLDLIIETLATEGRIELRNFGIFQVARRAPRIARNPRTRERVIVPERYVVTFKPGKIMEERIQHVDPTKARIKLSRQLQAEGTSGSGLQ